MTGTWSRERAELGGGLAGQMRDRDYLGRQGWGEWRPHVGWGEMFGTCHVWDAFPLTNTVQVCFCHVRYLICNLGWAY